MDVEIFADLVLENSEVDVVLVASPGDSNHVAEVVDCLSRVASPSHPIDGQNPWIVPTQHVLVKDHFVQFSF